MAKHTPARKIRRDINGDLDGGTLTIRVYMTTFCNRGHRLSDGMPVEHECYVLNPLMLRAEAMGADVWHDPDNPIPYDRPLYGESMKAVPERICRGVKSR